MALPFKRAKRRHQRARRRMHMPACHLGTPTLDRSAFIAELARAACIQRHMRAAGASAAEFAQAMHHAGTTAIGSLAGFTALQSTIEVAARRDQLAVRLSTITTLKHSEARDLIAKCEQLGIDPDRVIRDAATTGLDPAAFIQAATEGEGAR